MDKNNKETFLTIIDDYVTMVRQYCQFLLDLTENFRKVFMFFFPKSLPVGL